MVAGGCSAEDYSRHGVKEGIFPLYFTLLERPTRTCPSHQLGLWLVAFQAQVGAGLHSWLSLGVTFCPGSTGPASMDQISRKCSPGVIS